MKVLITIKIPNSKAAQGRSQLEIIMAKTDKGAGLGSKRPRMSDRPNNMEYAREEMFTYIFEAFTVTAAGFCVLAGGFATNIVRI